MTTTALVTGSVRTAPREPALSAALADVVAALQESTEIRMELMQERLLGRAERAGAKVFAWSAFAVCVIIAWLGAQTSFALFIGQTFSAISAVLSITAMHVVAAAVFFFIARRNSRIAAEGS